MLFIRMLFSVEASLMLMVYLQSKSNGLELQLNPFGTTSRLLRQHCRQNLDTAAGCCKIGQCCRTNRKLKKLQFFNRDHWQNPILPCQTLGIKRRQ